MSYDLKLVYREREPPAGGGDRAITCACRSRTRRSPASPTARWYVQVNENVRGADVFVIQPTCPPVNDTLMELLIMIDALKRASAHRITAVLPYYGYARQDRKVQPRVPISAKLVADLLEGGGVDRVLALDLPRRPDPGLLNVPVGPPVRGPGGDDRLSEEERPPRPRPRLSRRRRRGAGARDRQRLNASLAIIDKRRDKPGAAVAMNLIGDVDGPRRGGIDDMIDTAGTLVQAVTPSSARARGASWPAASTPCCRARPSTASRPPPSRRSSSPTRSRCRPRSVRRAG